MLSLIRRSALFISGFVIATLAAPSAFAQTQSGLDTTTGVHSLPIAVGGVAIMTLSDNTPSNTVAVNGKLQLSGWLGIGTTTPAAPLDVEGTGGVILNAGKVSIGTTNPVDTDVENAPAVLGIPNATVLDVYGDIVSGTGHFVSNYNGNSQISGSLALDAGPWGGMTVTPYTGIYFRSDNVLGKPGYVGATYRDLMFIRADGNVGIGTISPTASLDVRKSLVVANSDFVPNSTGSGLQIYGTAASGNTSTGIQAFQAGYTVGETLILQPWQYGVQIGPFNGSSTGSNLTVYGMVGIGTQSPAYPLDVNGEARFTGGYTTSDRRLKTNIADIGYGLGDVMKLRPVFFDWKKPVKGEEGRRVGFIAQEVEQIIPEIVSTAPDEMKTKAVEYGNITPVLVKAIQELAIENDKLHARLEALEAAHH